MDLSVAVDTSCPFLRLPPEIRLRIYGCLLFEPPRAFLDPSYHEKMFNAMMDARQEKNAFVDENDLDEHKHGDLDSEGSINQNDSYKYSYNNPGGAVMYNHLIVDQPDAPWETPFLSPPAKNEEKSLKSCVTQDEKLIADRKREFDDEHKVQRYPAIMQTNRQIYTESSTLLYSSLVIEVRPGDVMFSDTWDGIVELSDNIWRSCPLQVVVKNPIEGQEYKVSNLGGTMEPHAFAKFERVSFIADLDFVDKEEVPLWPTFFVDDEFHTNRPDEDTFVAHLNGKGSNRPPVSKNFRQFVDILVKSPYISHLDVSLDLEVDALFNVDSEEDKEEENQERCKQQNEEEERKINVANERAIELVLEAGVLNPLKQLSNAKCFELSFAVLPWNGIPFKPKPKHLEIIRDLKETVEGNFMAKHGAASALELFG